MDGSFQPRRAERVIVETIEEQTVLLHVDSGMYFALNDVGARVWDLCDGDHAVDAIVATLAEEYDAPAGEIRSDVEELLTEMRAGALLADR